MGFLSRKRSRIGICPICQKIRFCVLFCRGEGWGNEEMYRSDIIK
jgi:hypothetical protein